MIASSTCECTVAVTSNITVDRAGQRSPRVMTAHRSASASHPVQNRCQSIPIPKLKYSAPPSSATPLCKRHQAGRHRLRGGSPSPAQGLMIRTRKQPIEASRVAHPAHVHEQQVDASTPSRGKVVVVGGGPAGVLAAIYLAQQQYDVEVYERQARPDPVHRNLDRSYHLAMSHRGMGAVEKVGVDMRKFREFPYRGSLLRFQSGAVQEVFHEPISAKVLVERMELVCHMVDEAARLVPDRVQFKWSHACTGMNVQDRRASFQDGSGKEVAADYDLLVGADGVNSTVREQLRTQIAGFRQQWFGRMHRVDKFFHRVRPPPGTHMETHRGELDASATVLRFYYVDSPPPLSVGLFFIHNHADGSYSGGLSFTRADETEAGSGGSLKRPEDFEAVLNSLTMYPEAMRRDIAEQLAERPWYTSGSTLQVSRLTGPRVVLLGDAAHAVSAAFGQGVNSALEDCAVLGDILAEMPDNINAVLERFEAQRKPDVYALGTMDHQAEAFAGFRGRWNLSYWVFQTHLFVNGRLHKLFPQRFGDPGLVPMMTIQQSPYSAIYARIQRPFFILLISCLTALLAVATRAVRMLVVG